MSAKHWNRLGFERQLWQPGLRYVAGVDEAGCGPLAGPVVAAAVLFPCACLQTGLFGKLRGLNDSKQLALEQRERYFAVLTSHAEIAYAIGVVDSEMIDQINILQAAHRAMDLALEQLNPQPEHALVDGRPVKSLRFAHTPLVKGDCRSYSIAAASVIAKVTRDRMMKDFDRAYPGYGFAEHKGYATPEHLEAISRLGPCPIHRRSYSRFHPVALELFDDGLSSTASVSFSNPSTPAAPSQPAG